MIEGGGNADCRVHCTNLGAFEFPGMIHFPCRKFTIDLQGLLGEQPCSQIRHADSSANGLKRVSAAMCEVQLLRQIHFVRDLDPLERRLNGGAAQKCQWMSEASVPTSSRGSVQKFGSAVPALPLETVRSRAPGGFGIPGKAQVKRHRELPTRPTHAIICLSNGKWHLTLQCKVAGLAIPRE